jgi:N-acetyl sugar amidotransferase
MKFCKKCVQPDTRPGISFDEKGICPACNYIDLAENIDWEARKKELWEIVDKYKKHNKLQQYDCIIGVSGGKDSTRQVMYVKEVLGMNPLLVSCTYPPEQQTQRGAENLGNMINLGFDTISISPSPKTWKRLMREGFLRFGNWARSTEMALFASVPKVAIAYHIPLILWGENPAIQFGNLGVGSLNWDGNGMKNTNTLKGGPDALLPQDLEEQDIIWYRYPEDKEMEKANLQIVYLGYFWKDWSKINNGDFSIAHGLEVRDVPPAEQGSLYPFDALDDDFMIVNQMIKHVKYGFGKVNDEVCELIRAGKITRDEGIVLLRKYDGKCDPKYIKRVCQYLEISEEKFWEVVESFRNHDIWRKNEQGQWELKYFPDQKKETKKETIDNIDNDNSSNDGNDDGNDDGYGSDGYDDGSGNDSGNESNNYTNKDDKGNKGSNDCNHNINHKIERQIQHEL